MSGYQKLWEERNPRGQLIGLGSHSGMMKIFWNYIMAMVVQFCKELKAETGEMWAYGLHPNTIYMSVSASFH